MWPPLPPITPFPADIKSKMDLSLRSDAGGHVLMTCQSSSGLDDMDDDDESDSSSPPLPYLQAPPPDGCCTMDGTKTHLKKIIYNDITQNR